MLGSILIHQNDKNITSALTKAGVSSATAHRVAASVGTSAVGTRSASGQPRALVHDVRLAFAHCAQTIFYIMAGVMAATFIISVRRVPRGRVADVIEAEAVEPPVVAKLP